MRRAAVLIAAAGVVVAFVLVVATGGEDRYHVAAVFDRAGGIVGGQQVKIAGVVAGRIDSVELAVGPKARVVMDLDAEYAPFHADATCSILPEGLLSENFIACDPGTASKPEIADGSGVPTVPVQQTTVPASLQDVLNVFTVPTSDRVRLLVTELGLATAGRGEDLNALIRRSNPALAQARSTLAILDRQNQELATGIRQTDRVLASIGDDDVRGFVTRASAVARTSADHRSALSEATRELPGLLAEARPAFASLDQAMESGTPLLRSLRAGTPALDILTERVPSFARTGVRAFDGLSSISADGLRVLPTVRPVVAELRTAAERVAPMSESANRFLISFRDRGGIEGTLSMLYTISAFLSSYDDVSHIASLGVKSFPQCFEKPSYPGCSVKYDQHGSGTIPVDDPACGPQDGAIWQPLTACTSDTVSTRRATRRHSPARATPRRRDRRPQLVAPPPAATPAPSKGNAPDTNLLTPVLGALEELTGGHLRPQPGAPAGPDVQDLLDYLLGP